MAKLMNEASIPELLDEMTVEEKVDLIVGKSFLPPRRMKNTEFRPSCIWTEPRE